MDNPLENIMTWSDNLTGSVLDIARSTSSRLRVMAGPGTGKSFAMKRRILRLIEEDNIRPEKILALTFTRTAAADLKKDLHDLGIENVESIKAMTLHAFCFSLLNQRQVFEILRRKPRPIKSFQSKGSPQFELSPLLADIDLLGNFGDKREKFKKIQALEAAWARKQSDDTNRASIEDKNFKNSIIDWLTMHNSILLQELVPLALSFLENNPICEIFDSFSHIIVDEYQDLNKAEQSLIDLLGKNCKISVVGDVDQSIYYNLRYAHPDGIIDFSDRHKNQCESFTIVECRRCGKNIVKAANSLILNNHSNNSDRLIALPENINGKVRSVQWASFDDELAGIADFINSLLNSGAYKASDILILSPRKLLAYKLKQKLFEHKLPVHSFFHEEAVESAEAQKSVTLLNLMISPDDRVALRFWLGFGSHSWRAKQYKKLMEKANSENMSVKEWLDNNLSNDLEHKGISQIRESYQQLCNRIEILSTKSVSEIIDELFPESSDETKILRESSSLFLLENPGASIEDVWEHIEMLLTQPEMPESGEYIRIMSLHKSKGLASKVTIIMSCIEGLVPRREKNGSTQEAHDLLKEQRRLFYVAMTRAKEYLVISSFSKIPSNIAYKINAETTGRNNNKAMASQFISEAKLASITGEQWRSDNFS